RENLGADLRGATTAARTAVVADRAASRYPAGGAESDCGQRTDRCGTRAVLSTNLAHWILWQPKPRALEYVHRTGALGEHRSIRGHARISSRASFRRSAHGSAEA